MTHTGDFMSRKWHHADRHQVNALPPTIDELVPERHLARFVVDVVEEHVDLSAILAKYEKRNRGATPPYHPQMLVALLFYGYSTGIYSSRKIERATHDSLPFRFITGGLHPDHDTIANFRCQNHKELSALFTDILKMAVQVGLLKCGRISTDGSKIHANASKHSAVSYARAGEIEARLKAEVEELMTKAAEADATPNDDGLDIPAEIARREDRIAKLKAAREAIRARAAEKARLDAGNKKDGDGPGAGGGQAPPQAPDPEPDPKAQYNFTDPESRIMKTSDGFEQCFSGQLSVDNDSRLIVGQHVTQAATDSRELLIALQMISEVYGTPIGAIADAGFYSEQQIAAVLEKFPEIELHIAPGRTKHNRSLADRLAPEPPPPPPTASAAEKMRHKLATSAGKKIYALRKQTVEPVIGIIKSVLGFRQFLLRGFAKAQSEWGLVCIGYNLKRMFALEGGGKA